jgi:hypothetical protein
MISSQNPAKNNQTTTYWSTNAKSLFQPLKDKQCAYFNQSTEEDLFKITELCDY